MCTSLSLRCHLAGSNLICEVGKSLLGQTCMNHNDIQGGKLLSIMVGINDT